MPGQTIAVVLTLGAFFGIGWILAELRDGVSPEMVIGLMVVALCLALAWLLGSG